MDILFLFLFSIVMTFLLFSVPPFWGDPVPEKYKYYEEFENRFSHISCPCRFPFHRNSYFCPDKCRSIIPLV